jgi:hypothetical protein
MLNKKLYDREIVSVGPNYCYLKMYFVDCKGLDIDGRLPRLQRWSSSSGTGFMVCSPTCEVAKLRCRAGLVVALRQLDRPTFGD